MGVSREVGQQGIREGRMLIDDARMRELLSRIAARLSSDSCRAGRPNSYLAENARFLSEAWRGDGAGRGAWVVFSLGDSRRTRQRLDFATASDTPSGSLGSREETPPASGRQAHGVGARPFARQQFAADDVQVVAQHTVAHVPPVAG